MYERAWPWWALFCESSIWTRKLFLKYKSTWLLAKKELAINFAVHLAFENKDDEMWWNIWKTKMMKLKEMKWMKHARDDEISLWEHLSPKSFAVKL
jgi:hypothetical protein